MTNRTPRRFWTTPELAVIRREYPIGNISEIEARLPGRSRTAIYQQARIMGIKRPGGSETVRPSYPKSPEIDDAIRQLHATPPGKDQVTRLAQRLDRPVWWISRRARDLGLLTPRFREAPWSPAEIDILEDTIDLSPPAIRRRLARAGFTRSDAAIAVKRKRVGIFQSDRSDYTGAQAAELLGYDQSTVSRWIRQGILKASAAGQQREDGRITMWSVTPKNLRQFLIDNPMAFELRRIPAAHQPWLIELLSGRGPSVTA